MHLHPLPPASYTTELKRVFSITQIAQRRVTFDQRYITAPELWTQGLRAHPHLRSNDAVPAVQSPNLWGGQRILVVYRSGSLRPESCVRVSEAVSKSTGVVWSAFRNGVTVGFWTWLASPLSTVGSQVAWSHDDRRSWKSLSSADVSDSAWGVGSKVWRGHRALPTIGIFDSCVGRISRK